MGRPFQNLCITLLSLFGLSELASAVPSEFTTQTTCEGATEGNYVWNTTSSICTHPSTGEGAAETLTISNPQTLSVATLTPVNSASEVTLGSNSYFYTDTYAETYYPDENYAPKAAWGIKTNGRFSIQFSSDYSSIMEPSTNTPMFGSTPIINDFGEEVTWPALVKWETNAEGKQYDGNEVSGAKRFEVLPGGFVIEIINIDSVSGSNQPWQPDDSSSIPEGFQRTGWGGNGKAIINANDENNFSDHIGLIQVADRLGASSSDGSSSTIPYLYTWTDTENNETHTHGIVLGDQHVGVFMHPYKDYLQLPGTDNWVQPNFSQAGTYYTAVKLTVTAEQSDF